LAEDDQTEALCLQALREHDRDRYLATLLAPSAVRGDLAALYAFNAELARVRDLVRDPLPGEIRLQYWRDLLAGSAHGATAANPVGAGLLRAIERHRLPVDALMGLIDARLFDLYDDPMETRTMLEGYAGETASALLQLASLMLDPDLSARHTETAGHAGVAQAVAGLILLLPTHIARGQVFVPLDLLASVGLDRESFLLGEDRPRLSAAIEAFAGLGREHLQKARATGRPASKIMPAYLPATLAAPVIERAARAPLSALETGLRPPQWRRQITLLRGLLTRRL